MSFRLTYPKFWFFWLFVLALIELIAVVNPHKGDTFSEYTWSKLNTLPMQMLVGAVLFWLAWHFLFARFIGLSWRDIVAVVIGLSVGALAFYTRKMPPKLPPAHVEAPSPPTS